MICYRGAGWNRDLPSCSRAYSKPEYFSSRFCHLFSRRTLPNYLDIHIIPGNLVMPVNSSFLHAASKKQPATKRVLEISFYLSRIVLAFNISIYKYPLYAKAQVSMFH